MYCLWAPGLFSLGTDYTNKRQELSAIEKDKTDIRKEENAWNGVYRKLDDRENSGNVKLSFKHTRKEQKKPYKTNKKKSTLDKTNGSSGIAWKKLFNCSRTKIQGPTESQHPQTTSNKMTSGKELKAVSETAKIINNKVVLHME